MKIFLLILIFNLLIFNSFGQNEINNSEDQKVIESFEEKLVGTVLSANSILNGQFYTKDWYLGSVLLYNNKIVKGKYLKYNGFKDLFVWLSGSKYQQASLEKSMIEEVFLTSIHKYDSLHFKKIKINNVLSPDSSFIFAQVMVQGKISLYIYRKLNIFSTSNLYEPDFQYFIKKQDNQLYRFSSNRKSLLGQFPEKKKELRAIIRKNWLRIRIEKDLIKAIELLNLQLEKSQ